MAPSADQTAMLELLLDGGQSYEELAELFGLDRSEVKLRARTALAAIGGSDPDRKVPLSDYLLGKADPIDRADAVRHLKDDPDDFALAERIRAGLAEIAPNAELVSLPSESSGGRFLRKSPPGAAASGAPGGPAKAPSRSRTSLTPRQTRLVGVLGGGAVILIAIVLAVTGAFSGSDDSSDGGSPSSGDPSLASNGTDANGNDTATIQLKAPGNGKASGVASIGTASGDQPYVDLSIKNLDPAPDPKKQVYVVWMMLTKKKGYPLTPIQTNDKGSFQNRYPINSAVLEVVAHTQMVNVSLASVKATQAQLKKAMKKNQVVLPRLGKTALTGDVPTSAQTTVSPQSGSGDTSTTPQSTTPDAGTTTAPEGSTTTPSTTTPDSTTTTPDSGGG